MIRCTDIFDLHTGELIPESYHKLRRIRVVVKSSEYECGHYTEDIAPEELDDFMETHDIYDCYEVEVTDPAEMAERRRAFRRIWNSSCIMPPVEDLRLTLWAKLLPPEDYEKIDPASGIFKQTRERLNSIRAAKRNAARYDHTPTPRGAPSHKH